MKSFIIMFIIFLPIIVVIKPIIISIKKDLKRQFLSSEKMLNSWSF